MVWERLGAFWGSQWDLHPDRSVLTLAIALAYTLGLFGLRGQGARLQLWVHVPIFVLGLATLVVAIQSPLHHLSDRYLFSAHMLQHQLLTLVVPPLLLLGVPRFSLPSQFDAPWLTRFGRGAHYPIVAFAVFNLLFAFLHFPTLYDALFADELLHFVIHAALLLTALFTWMPVLSPLTNGLPRLSLPAQMLYCFVQTIPGSLVGSLITLADRLVYRHYGTQPLELGFDPVADQQLGGLLMWVGSGSLFLLILTVLFFIWADREERSA